MLRLSNVGTTASAGAPQRVSPGVRPGVLALAFVASVAVTVLGGDAIALMGAMPMPGYWTLSMVWMRMGGQGWLAAAGGFLVMWMPMMAAMMLPSLGPVLSRYGRTLACAGVRRPGRMAAAAALGYFLVWATVGVAIYPLGAALAQAAMGHRWLARMAPFAAAAVVVLAGALQFTAWKARRLACCRSAPGAMAPPPGGMAAGLRRGLRLGLYCACCCGNLMAISLVAGMMDLRIMAAVTLAITAERLLPAGERVARGVGLLAVGVGVLLIVRAISGGWRLSL
ncbi:DUF2182 domain-containing protein [Frateuria sp. GZRe12]|uniref:copper chaperone n=1 Tax=Frateuria sp. GZRe12 TaxID=3351533 RepID=UPI003EDBA5FD